MIKSVICDQSVKVLDKGYVKLVDYMGSDLSIARNARCLADAEWRPGIGKGTDHALINYLWKNQHTTPFESVSFTFEVKAPIFVFRQWHRHRTWSYNEVSARYQEVPEEYYIPDLNQICAQASTNKQGRTDEPLEPEIAKLIQATIKEQNAHSFDTYHTLLHLGLTRELARTVLPVGTYSLMFGTVSLLNLFRFIVLRSDPHAQYEIKVYSDAILNLIEPIAPVAIEAFKRNKFKLQSSENS